VRIDGEEMTARDRAVLKDEAFMFAECKDAKGEFIDAITREEMSKEDAIKLADILRIVLPDRHISAMPHSSLFIYGP
jgi:hypothetical protein